MANLLTKRISFHRSKITYRLYPVLFHKFWLSILIDQEYNWQSLGQKEGSLQALALKESLSSKIRGDNRGEPTICGLPR